MSKYLRKDYWRNPESARSESISIKQDALSGPKRPLENADRTDNKIGREFIETILEGMKINPNCFIRDSVIDIAEKLPEESDVYEYLEDSFEVKDYAEWFFNNIEKIIKMIEALGDSYKDQCGCIISIGIFKDFYHSWNTNKPAVYFISNSIGRIKIGYTRNLQERLKSLIAASGDELQVIYKYTPQNVSIEHLELELHHHFRANRVIGEWFNIDNDITTLEDLCKSFDNP